MSKEKNNTNNAELYSQVSLRLARDVTETYSSSFSAATSLLYPKISDSIVSIYAFVRIADEIVDTWRPSEMESYLNDLTVDVKRAIKSGFSPNPIVHSFSAVVRDYKIPLDLIDAFMKSMRMDIKKRKYNQQDYKRYIYGSAEAVGLMCLMVFVGGNKRKYSELMPGARALGSAFQKINFLRDYASDHRELGRIYFSDQEKFELTDENKQLIINDIIKDLRLAKPAIAKLPNSSRLGVELAYRYFNALTKLASKTPANSIKSQRLSLGKSTKVYILASVRAKKRFTK